MIAVQGGISAPKKTVCNCDSNPICTITVCSGPGYCTIETC
jgi:hypothetical protein